MRRSRLLVTLFAATMLGSCGELAPYPTVPRSLPPAPATPARPAKATAPVQSSPVIPRVGICYNRLTTTLAEVREQAQRECPANTVANQTDSDWYMEHCPLLLPGTRHLQLHRPEIASPIMARRVVR